LVGNPALKPEKSESVDAGLEHRFAGNGTLEFGGFANRYRDGIDFDPGPPPRLVNRNEIRSEGLEAYLRWRMSAEVDLTAAGTYAEVRSEPGGGRLRGRPRGSGSLRADWRPVPGWRIQGVWMAVGGVPDSSVPTGAVVLPSWQRVDVAAWYETGRRVTVLVAVDNLLDARYEEAIGVPSPGMRWRGGLEVKF
jgi:outer membrane receptor protein involved in Fe transport